MAAFKDQKEYTEKGLLTTDEMIDKIIYIANDGFEDQSEFLNNVCMRLRDLQEAFSSK